MRIGKDWARRKVSWCQYDIGFPVVAMDLRRPAGTTEGGNGLRRPFWPRIPRLSARDWPARRLVKCMLSSRWIRSILGLGTAAALQAASAPAPTAEAIRQLPPAAIAPVDFVKDVQPILEASCVKCHGRGKEKGGWRLDTRETALAAGDSGVSIVPGKGGESRLIHLVAGTDPDEVMPQKGKRLTPAEVGILRAWIDQGAVWPGSVGFGRVPANNLVVRTPELPMGRAGHPLDRFLEAYAARQEWKLPKTVDDRTFIRRAHLDLVGLPPTAGEWAAFEKDRSADRRTVLVKRLLSDRQRYAQHWLTYWNDLLRNDYKGTGYIDGGRKPMHRWLYTALRDNLPYDRFVRELVNPGPESEGFTKGIVWRGEVNASMTPSMQAAQNVSQVFMGVNLKCASCHDSFIDDWQLSDCYGLAGVFAEGPLQMVQCDKPTGKLAPLRFLFPELGAVDASAPRSNRLEQLARIITQPANGRLSRTVVNRLWARLMGRGLVEPLDVMQNPAWDADLLDWLAEDLAAHGWNLQRTIELILTSRAYQLPSVDEVEVAGQKFAFRGPVLRRLTAEQFRDTLGQLTDAWFDKPEGGLESLMLEPSAQAATGSAPTPFWIWGDAHAASGVPPSTNWLRREVILPVVPEEAVLYVQVDNSARVFLNGKRLKGTEAADWATASVYDLRSGWVKGTNVLGIEAINGGDGPNPAGLIAYVRLRSPAGRPGEKKSETRHDLASDAGWKASKQLPARWPATDAEADWQAASVLGGESMAPWNQEPRLARLADGARVFGQVRSALATADPLLLALGRPNREQVTTVRPTAATTLQALELTNGETLARLLHRGAEKLVAKHPAGRSLIEHVFEQGLGRLPSRTERQASLELVGDQARVEGVEDLLWSVAMLPEFQFIR